MRLLSLCDYTFHPRPFLRLLRRHKKHTAATRAKKDTGSCDSDASTTPVLDLELEVSFLRRPVMKVKAEEEEEEEECIDAVLWWKRSC